MSGRFTGVAGALGADLLVVPLGGGLVAVVESGQAQVEPVVSLDVTRPLATVTLDRAPATVLDGASVDEALLFAAGLLASEQVGIAEWCLTTTVAYLKERRQFARPVGSFQALKHRLADLWLEVAGARAAARNAADRLAAGADARVAVAVAAAHCGEVAVRVAEEALQLHGGIGMTWEHPVHLYLKRAKADAIAFGTPGDHRNALAPLVGLPGPVVEWSSLREAGAAGRRRSRRGPGAVGGAVVGGAVTENSVCRGQRPEEEVGEVAADLVAGERAVGVVPGAEVVDGAEEEVDHHLGRDVGAEDALAPGLRGRGRGSARGSGGVRPGRPCGCRGPAGGST